MYPNDASTTFVAPTKSVKCPPYMGLVGVTEYWYEGNCQTAGEGIYSAEGEGDEEDEQHELQIALAIFGSKEDPLVEELATRCNDFDTTPVSTDTVCFILFSYNNIVSEIIPLSSILQIFLQGSWQFFFPKHPASGFKRLYHCFALSLLYVDWKLRLGSNLVHMIINFIASKPPSKSVT